jgi:hypothetical protein
MAVELGISYDVVHAIVYDVLCCREESMLWRIWSMDCQAAAP